MDLCEQKGNEEKCENLLSHALCHAYVVRNANKHELLRSTDNIHFYYIVLFEIHSNELNYSPDTDSAVTLPGLVVAVRANVCFRHFFVSPPSVRDTTQTISDRFSIVSM